jgi:MurNAc alpha-1-phosphate uridylyltransferase
MRLAAAFDPERHDAALLMQETVPAVGYDGRGDFSLDPVGVPRRRGENEVVPFLFAGVQLLSRRLFAGEPVAPYSMNRLWDKAIAQGRIVAIVHDGTWYDVGTVAGLAATESRLGELWFPR